MPLSEGEALLTMLTASTLDLNFPGVRVRLYRHEFKRMPLKTMAFFLSEKRRVLSTREGFREVELVAENSCPPEGWEFVHSHPEEFFKGVYESLGISPSSASFLFTGADVERGVFRNEREVLVFATADPMNARCVGRDMPLKRRKFSGTINIFLFTQAELSQAAMAHLLITITEAKVEALKELDIRSVYSRELQATGTGTDEVIVVSGRGEGVERLKGHSELSVQVGKVVLEAVVGAIKKQKEV